MVGRVQAVELVRQQVQVRGVVAGIGQERRHVARHEPRRQPGQVYGLPGGERRPDPSGERVRVRHVYRAGLREKRRGRRAVARRHAPRPRHERVVHHHAHGAALLRLGAEERGHGLRPDRLQPGQVRVRAAGLRDAAAVAAVRDGGDADGARGRVVALAQDEPGRGERAPDAGARGEALAELEHRVDVALAWVRKQEDVDALL